MKHHAHQRAAYGHQGRHQVRLPMRRRRPLQHECRLRSDDPVDHERPQHRGQQHRPEKTAVEISNDLLQHKCDGRQRRVERCCQSGRRSSRRRLLAVLFRFPQKPA